ncbi:MAG: PIN domain-containing protein [Candidatus Binatia bacterium]
MGEVGGHPYQTALWNLRATARLVILDLTREEADRMAMLMEKYKDAPMNLADALLVTVAESRSLRRVFTVDKAFYIYRLSDGSALKVVR